MHTDLTIHNELKGLSQLLAGLPNTNVFTVPEGYFENLAADILYNVDNGLSINELSRSTAHMDIPEAYFDGLADTIMNRIRSEVTNNIAEEPDTSFINPARYINTYTIPTGYFDSLAGEIMKKLPQPAKVLTMTKTRVFFSRYAVAAAITGLLGLSLFTIFDKKQGTGSVSEQTSPVIATTNDILKNNSFDKVLETLGDEEIVSYLQDNGEDVNAALVASVTDENNLPNEEEYFIDEKTLDNFLSDQHITLTNN
jgi:hypothetical protein